MKFVVRASNLCISWEQRKLAELVTRYEDPVETPHDGYIRLGIRSHAKGTFHEYVEPGHELETAQMHRVAANKLIFNITFAWEHAVAVTTEDDAGKLVSHRFPQFSLSELLRPEFLKYVILDEGFHHKLYLASPGGAGRNRVLKVDEALDYPIFFPSVEEQHKIGEFLNQLNDLITLHQSKAESWKNKENQLSTISWEQRKLFEMATFSKGSGYSKADLAPSGTPIILYGRMYTKYETIIKEVDTFAEEKAGSVYSKGGEVIVPASGETAEDISRASVVENTGVLLGGDINIIHPNDNLIPGFLALTISNGNQQKKLSAKAQGASIVHLHNEDLKDVDILYPTIAEQRKISEFFQGLDDTITLHQRKCGDLKELKRVAFNGISLKSPGRRRIWHNGIL